MAISALNIGASAVSAGMSALSNSAHSVANMSTRNFQPIQANFTEASPAGSGVTISYQAQQLQAGDAPSGTDFATEATNSLVYKAQVQTSLSLIKTADETLGTLLDIRA